MRILKLAFFLWANFFVSPPSFATQFLAVTTVPEDGILNPDPTRPEGILTLFFSTDLSGTVTFSAISFSPRSVSYTTPMVTMSVTFPASEFPLVNEFFTLSLRLVAHDNSQAVTEVTVAVDATPPPPPSGVNILPANRAVFIYWDPALPFPPPFNRNVDAYTLYYSGLPLTDALNITATTEREGMRVGFPDPASPGTAITAQTFPYKDHYFLPGLTNGEPVYLTLEAIDHAGNRSGVILNEQGKPIIYIGYPTETSTFSELTGVKDQCFIVTAAFGNPNSPWVKLYRKFRDHFLLAFPGGRELVHLYYREWGPRGASWLRTHELRRLLVLYFLIVASPITLLLILLTPWGILALFFGATLLWLCNKRGILLLPPRFSKAVKVPCTPSRRKVGSSELFFLLTFSILMPFPGSPSAQESFALRVSPFFPRRIEGIAPNAQRIRYQDLYGPHGTYRFDLEYTYYPFRFLGEWGGGGSAGFSTDSGKALALQSDGYVKSGEDARMSFLPLSVFLRYRAHYFDDQPILVTLYGGGEAAGVQESRRTLSNSIQTYSYGYFYGGEMELLLDLIDSGAAAYMDYNYSIKDTTLFVGYAFHRLDNLGGKPTLDLSYRGWVFGLRFVY